MSTTEMSTTEMSTMEMSTTGTGTMEKTYPEVKTVLGLWEDLKDSTAIAVICADRQYTYREIIERAKKAAGALCADGIKKGDRILISMRYSEDLVCAVMAALYAGAAYVAIDRAWPKERIDYIYKNSGAVMILTDELFGKLVNSDSQEELPRVKGTDDFAVYYTSGSTGNPKGAVLTHNGIQYAMQSVPENIFFDESETSYSRVFSICNFAFVGKIADIFLSLTRGKTLVMATDEERLSPTLIGKRMRETDCDVFMGTPSTVLRYLDNPEFSKAFRQLHRVLFYGESLSQTDILRLTEHSSAALYSIYAATELPTGSITRLKAGRETVYDHPYYGTELLVINEYGEVLDDGQEGEAGMAGPGARGSHYLNDPEMDRRKYITVPGYGRTYRTGDRAIRLPEGGIRILGRIDDMQKIRGQRVEPREIEITMEKYPGIKRAAAAVRGKGESAVLCAWYCVNQPVDPEKLRRFLSERLPDYMVPERMSEMAELGLNSNGKLDRRSLPDIEIQAAAYEAPKNEWEEILCRAFADALEMKDSVGRDDDFFMIGGNSLRALILISNLYEAHSGRPGIRLNTDLLKQYPTPALLANALAAGLIERTKQETGEEAKAFATEYSSREIIRLPEDMKARLEEENVEAVLPVSNNTLGFLDLKRYGVTGMLNEWNLKAFVDAAWDEEAFRERAQVLAQNHPALRSTFVTDKAGTCWQVIFKKKKLSCYYKDLRHLSKEAQENFLDGFQHVLTNNQELWKAACFCTGDDRSVVLLSASHTIVDAISVFVLLNELCADAFKNYTTDRYLEHRVRLCRDSSLMPDWIHSYYAKATPLKNPEFFKMPAGKGQGGKLEAQAYLKESVTLSSALTDVLRSSCRQSGVSPYEYVQYCFGQAMLDMLQRDEVWLMTLESGRYADWENELRIIGNMTLWLPVRMYRGQSLEDLHHELSILRSYPSLSDERLIYNDKWKGIYEGVVSNDFTGFMPPITSVLHPDTENRSGIGMYLEKQEGLAVVMRYAASSNMEEWYRNLAGRLCRWLMHMM